jgi:hypothetical protein
MYKLTQNSFGQTLIIKTDGNATTSFLEDPANTEYQAYLKWLAEGNQPLPADQPE